MNIKIFVAQQFNAQFFDFFLREKLRVNKRFFNIFVLKTIFERVNATKWSDIFFHFIHAFVNKSTFSVNSIY